MSVVRFVSNARVPLNALPELKAKALNAAGIEVSGKAIELAPRDTSRLKSSITYKLVSESEVHVGTNVEYAIYVHEDLQAFHREGQAKYISEAIEQEENNVRQLVKDALEGRL